MGKRMKTGNSHLRLGIILSWVWGSWIVLLLTKAIHYQTMRADQAPETTMVFIAIHFITVAVILLFSAPPKLSILFVGAFFIRLIFLIIDRFTNLEIPFLERNGDAGGYFRSAAEVAGDLTLAGETYGGVYTAIVGYLFYLVGPDRVMGQYFNVILGLSSVILLARILGLLEINQRIARLITGIAAFMPMVAMNSSVLLREAIIQILVTAALFAFFKGIIESKFSWTFVSLLCVLGASTFHSGVIGVLIGFAVASAFTYRQGGRFVFGVKRIAPALLLFVSAIVVLLRYPELFLGKFSVLESPDDILDTGLSKLGGSAYLTGLEVDSWFTFIAYAPLRAFYFVASPLPWEWRGFGDMLSFSVDSTVYLAPVILLFIFKITDPNRRYLVVLLALILLVTCLIFGAGVSNTGTAIRHRTKLLGIFLVLLAIILDSARTRIFARRKRRVSGMPKGKERQMVCVGGDFLHSKEMNQNDYPGTTKPGKLRTDQSNRRKTPR